MGSQLSIVILPLIAIVVLDASSFSVAMLGFAMTVPVFLFGLPFGVIVDRLPRRRLMIAAHAAAAVAMLAIPLAYLVDGLNIALLCLSAGLGATFSLLYEFAATAYLPESLPKTQLLRANSMIETSRSVSESVGPMAAGALVSVLAAPYVVLLDSLSFAASALLLRMRPAPGGNSTPAEGSQSEPSLQAFLADSREGFRFVLGNAVLRAVAITTTWLNLFSAAATVLQTIYMLRVLHMTPVAFGLVLGIGNTGAVAAALLASLAARRLPVGRLLVFSAAITGGAYLLVPAASTTYPIPFLVVAGFLGGLSGVWYNITVLTVRQAVTPPHLLGRSIAVLRLAVWGSIPLGSLLAGVGATLLSVRACLWIAAIGATVSFLWLLGSPVPGFVIRDESRPSLAIDVGEGVSRG